MRSRFPIHLERDLERVWAAYIDRVFARLLKEIRKGYEKELPTEPASIAADALATDGLSKDLTELVARIDDVDLGTTGATVNLDGIHVSKSMARSINRVVNELDKWTFDITKAASERFDKRRGTEMAVNVLRSSPKIDDFLKTQSIANAKLIKNLQKSHVTKVANEVRASLRDGTSLVDLEKKLQKIAGVDRRTRGDHPRTQSRARCRPTSSMRSTLLSTAMSAAMTWRFASGSISPSSVGASSASTTVTMPSRGA